MTLPGTQVKQRLCEALDCYEPMPLDAPSNRMYHDRKCAQRMAQARSRRAARLKEGKAPTPADIRLAEIEAARIRRSNKANAEIEAEKQKRAMAQPSPQVTPDGEGGAGYFPSFGSSSGADPLHDTPLEFTVLQGTETRTRRGAGYVEFVNRGTAELLAKKKITKVEAASIHEVNPSTITGWMNSYLEDKTQQSRRRSHELTEQQKEILNSYEKFTQTFFPNALIPTFHLDWAEALRQSMENGDRHMLLAPQRHGKSEMLIRECVRQILLNPDICILWVGKTVKLASKMVGMVRQILEHNVEIKEMFLPEGDEFPPGARSGMPWKNDEFTVSTRTEVRKSATITALGTGSTILGLDADLIVIDDPIDRDLCLSPTERQNVEEWFFTDFISRKEEHTGVIYIGSRQHHQDLPGEIIRKDNELIAQGYPADWYITVYRAHNPNCKVGLPPNAPRHTSHSIDNPEMYAEHDSSGCVLWPEFRTFGYLMGQRRSNPEHFERNYLNNPSSDAFIAVTEEDLKASYEMDKWFSITPRSQGHPNVWQLERPRTVGTVPPGTRLVASIDPATAKPNAAVLWAYTSTPHPVPNLSEDSPQTFLLPTRAVVDIAETPRPGSPGITNLIDRWYEQYKVVDWVFETNIYKDQVRNDSDLADRKSRLGLRFLEHVTSPSTKHDPVAGVLAMLAQFRNRPPALLLPNGDDLTARRISRLTHQLLNFDPEISGGGPRRSNADDDLVMAMWFGWYWLERNSKALSQTIRYEYPVAFSQMGNSSMVGAVNLPGLNWTRPPDSWKASA